MVAVQSFTDMALAGVFGQLSMGAVAGPVAGVGPLPVMGPVVAAGPTPMEHDGDVAMELG